MTLRSAIFPLLLSCTLAACSESVIPATQVVVAIDADSEVASVLTRVRAEIYAPAAQPGDRASDAYEFELGGTNAPGALPLSFGVLKGSSAGFLLVIQGFAADDDAPTIEYKATARFTARRTMLLSVHLAEGCLTRADACSALDVTCDPGDPSVCVAVSDADTRQVKPGDELGGFGTGDDAGALDAGGNEVDASEVGDASVDEPDASEESDASEQRDASGNDDLDAGADAGDAEAGPPPLTGVVVGAPCSAQGTFACLDRAQAQRLTCQGTWTATEACADGTLCDARDGSCAPVVAQCAGQSSNATVCVGAAANVCGADLVTVEVQPVTAGVCGAQCSQGASQCAGAVPQSCSGAGQWQNGSVSAGTCGAVCTPTTRDCAGTTPRTCDANGQWQNGTVTLGQCGAVCAPGAMRCDLTNFVGQQCQASGTWGSNGSAVLCNCTQANRYTRVDQNLVRDTSTNLVWDFYVQPLSTWDAAGAACAARGMRLPTLGEWGALRPADVSFDYCKGNAVPLDLAGLPTTTSDFPFWVNSQFSATNGNVMRYFASTTTAPGTITSTDRLKTQPMSYRCVR